MKNLVKRISAMFLCLLMTMGIATTAFAANSTYTITAPDNGHSYEVYQIFTGDLDAGVLSNIKWGQNGTGYVSGQTTYVAGTITQELEALASKTDAEKLTVITKYVDLNSTAYTTIAANASESVPSGYYLIKDVDGTQDNDSSYTLYIVKVVGDTTITPKTSTPEVEKKVYEEEKGWQDGADYDIGNSVPYKLTATMGDISMYPTYYVQFDDVLCKGITLDENSVKVYVVNGESEVEVTNSFNISSSKAANTTDTYADGTNLLVTCDNIKAISGVTIQEGTKIVVKYSATLNENAQIGSTGNPNEVKLIYSNNPNENHGGDKGTTPEDKVTVFTYKLLVNKVDGNGNPLKGAGFTLYKETESGQTAIGEEIKGTDLTTFTWEGLDAGNYILKETTTPDGYNKIDDVSFTIQATYDTEANDPQLTDLKVVSDSEFSAELTSGKVETTIKNFTGAVLPSTGGIGTTMFYVVGGILLIGASVLLITKKRMGVRK
jgi:fimbrial isopeptide formation D2 family protein/LPXTG-motif cell wall-anchored protein